MVSQHRPSTFTVSRSANSDRTLHTALSVQRANRTRVGRAGGVSDASCKSPHQGFVTTSAAHFATESAHQKPEEATSDLVCVQGTPVVWGTPRRSIQIDDDALDFQMLLHIQTDDYRSIRHMILAGWRPRALRDCNFALALNHDAASQLLWEVSEATPLHFALCCGLFQAAAVLLVAFPEHADLTCVAKESSGEERKWNALDITTYLAGMFREQPAKAAAYADAAVFLTRLQEDKQSVPFVNIPSPVARLHAVGSCPVSGLAALLVPSLV